MFFFFGLTFEKTTKAFFGISEIVVKFTSCFDEKHHKDLKQEFRAAVDGSEILGSPPGC